MTATASPASLQSRIDALALRDGRYAGEAFHFVFDSLDFVLDRQEQLMKRSGRTAPADRHVSVPQLLEGIREYALAEFGPLARLVLERWGLFRTEDFGEIVFALVEGRLLNKQETDRKLDFRNGFNFREAFDLAWRPTPKLGA
ncbi:MAG: Minf_1886 family protein [Planctomycetota bacterium]